MYATTHKEKQSCVGMQLGCRCWPAWQLSPAPTASLAESTNRKTPNLPQLVRPTRNSSQCHVNPESIKGLQCAIYTKAPPTRRRGSVFSWHKNYFILTEQKILYKTNRFDYERIWGFSFAKKMTHTWKTKGKQNRKWMQRVIIWICRKLAQILGKSLKFSW